MGEASGAFHEPVEKLTEETMESRRGYVSLIEELDAVNWYDQRIDATEDEQLRAILAHNRDEEKEHAMMLLEWLRRRDAPLDEHMRTFLFTQGDIMGAEGDGEQTAAASGGADSGSLGIGSLREAL